jgi:hypothetical protein
MQWPCNADSVFRPKVRLYIASSLSSQGRPLVRPLSKFAPVAVVDIIVDVQPLDNFIDLAIMNRLLILHLLLFTLALHFEASAKPQHDRRTPVIQVNDQGFRVPLDLYFHSGRKCEWLRQADNSANGEQARLLDRSGGLHACLCNLI